MDQQGRRTDAAGEEESSGESHLSSRGGRDMTEESSQKQLAGRSHTGKKLSKVKARDKTYLEEPQLATHLNVPMGNLSHSLASITDFRKSEGAFQPPTYPF